MPPRAASPRRLDGLLFFPVTAFDQQGRFAPDAYRAHVQARLTQRPGAVFAACGTGEFPALAPAEYEQIVRTAVEAADAGAAADVDVDVEAADGGAGDADGARAGGAGDGDGGAGEGAGSDGHGAGTGSDDTRAGGAGHVAGAGGPGSGGVAGRVPVIGGCGYGTALALEYARAAERAGADGLLVLPPYSAAGGQDGLLRHYTALAAGTDLDLILYQRDTTVFTPETVIELAQVPNIIGFKDGRGDLDLMLRVVSAVRTSGTKDFQYFNGMPTAEMTQQAYRAVGVPLYSSAVFCFAPDLALAFHGALERDDRATVDRLIDVFFRPYVELRHSRPGYAVSLVKALTRATGHDVGPVRAPLVEPAAEHVAEALALIDRARDALAALGKA